MGRHGRRCMMQEACQRSYSTSQTTFPKRASGLRSDHVDISHKTKSLSLSSIKPHIPISHLSTPSQNHNLTSSPYHISFNHVCHSPLCPRGPRPSQPRRSPRLPHHPRQPLPPRRRSKPPSSHFLSLTNPRSPAKTPAPNARSSSP